MCPASTDRFAPVNSNEPTTGENASVVRWSTPADRRLGVGPGDYGCRTRPSRPATPLIAASQFGQCDVATLPTRRGPDRIHPVQLRRSPAGQDVGGEGSASSLCFSPVQILRYMRCPSSPTRGLMGRYQPLGCTCQSHDSRVEPASLVQVRVPVVSIIELVVREPSRRGRSNSVSSMSMSMPALAIRARNLVPSPIGSGVSSSTSLMAGWTTAPDVNRRRCRRPAAAVPRSGCCRRCWPRGHARTARCSLLRLCEIGRMFLSVRSRNYPDTVPPTVADARS